MTETRENWHNSQPIMSDWLKNVGDSTVCYQYKLIEGESYGMVWDYLRYKFGGERKVFLNEARTYAPTNPEKSFDSLTAEERELIPPADHQIILRRLCDQADNEHGEQMNE